MTEINTFSGTRTLRLTTNYTSAKGRSKSGLRWPKRSAVINAWTVYSERIMGDVASVHMEVRSPYLFGGLHKTNAHLTLWWDCEHCFYSTRKHRQNALCSV